jgi:hypothetical protein
MRAASETDETQLIGGKQMSRNVFGWSVVGVFALAAGLAAQEPTPYPQTPPRTPAAQEQMATVTVEGCLVREQDVPGRKPNVAERAGVLEDYILTGTKMVKGTAPQQASTAKPGEAVGTSGAAAMYDVKGISDEQLKQFVGKRVQIEGSFADATRSPAAGATEDLIDIRGTTIKAASGECPAK